MSLVNKKTTVWHSFAMLAASVLIGATLSWAQPTYTVLHNLLSPGAQGGLTFDTNGNLYGAAKGSPGPLANGTVFELRHSKSGSWTWKLLYRFLGGSDGREPFPVIFDSAGNLRGTTLGGGTSYCPYSNRIQTCGTVFELNPTPKGQWTKKILYSFTGSNNGGNDAANPSSGLIADDAGNLYGETTLGMGHGTVFALRPGPDGTWTETVLYRFTGGADGWSPSGGLSIGPAGNLYGTTSHGGDSTNCPLGCGTVFELSPGPTGDWTFKTLYAFCSSSGCPDGAIPLGGMALDSKGNLFGTTSAGGIAPCWWRDLGCGTAYKLVPETGRFRLLHSFCPEAYCLDGAGPSSGLVPDGAGGFYGETVVGGNRNQGTVFRLSRDALGHWNVESLYSFCALDACADGGEPSGGVTLDSAGNIYGTTQIGHGYGVIFQIIP